MPFRSFLACLGLTAGLALPGWAAESERNDWPVKVEQLDGSGLVQSWQAAGPLLFGQPLDNGRTAKGFRPFYLEKRDATGTLTETSYAYPILTYRNDGDSYRWSFLQLINLSGPPHGEPTEGNYRGFDVWPFYFSRETGSPETSYRALFPIAGTVKNRLFNERMSWLLFPAYLRTDNHGVTAVSLLWPFVRTIHGAGNTGFALWPLFGWRRKPGVSHSEFYAWPLIYQDVSKLDGPKTEESFGVLPFYTSVHSADVASETYAWPFFGYTHRTAPYRYDETRYFWPLFLQGEGDNLYRNRWAPFYTHSIVKGVDKTWVMWPFFRRQDWVEGKVAQTRTQFLFFLYWSLQQRSATNPRVAAAEKTHYWPFASIWDNGAGHRQVQVLSPIEVFFPTNENTGLLWTPLFALYRYDRRAPDDTRHSLLFNLVTWRHDPARSEFHLGPLIGIESSATEGRITIAGGLWRLARTGDGHGWKSFWFDFSAKSDNHPPPPP
jgi:hypothetical protein